MQVHGKDSLPPLPVHEGARLRETLRRLTQRDRRDGTAGQGCSASSPPRTPSAGLQVVLCQCFASVLEQAVGYISGFHPNIFIGLPVPVIMSLHSLVVMPVCRNQPGAQGMTGSSRKPSTISCRPCYGATKPSSSPARLTMY